MFQVYFNENVETMCIHETYSDFCIVYHRHNFFCIAQLNNVLTFYTLHVSASYWWKLCLKIILGEKFE